ncbi:MAG: metallophosphoesterase [Bacteriovoracaceae bacterium]|nr:metallophosphoesterase [Bacteriovoracaceae bacterium]
MRFLQKEKVYRTVIVLSDLHMGAGVVVNDRKNYLEDFHYDKELIDLLEYYSSGKFYNREVELVLNGDIFDFLAVPFVQYFDDEFWSEKASIEKLKMIVEPHKDFIQALISFVSIKKKKIIYILGNHDAELIFQSLREYFLSLFPEKHRGKCEFLIDKDGEYSPVDGVLIKHGHEYEVSHKFHTEKSIIEDNEGEKYFIPPWGSYYVTRVLNKFKEERHYADSVRPIRKFVINGIIYDTLFTIRFVFASIYYFIMVRFIYFFKQSKNYKKLASYIKDELQLFRDYETITQEFLEENESVRALILGHTHLPAYRTFSDGSIFINTGTWTKMFNLDFGKQQDDYLLTYAQIDIRDHQKKRKRKRRSSNDSCIDLTLNVWRGRTTLPFYEFR